MWFFTWPNVTVIILCYNCYHFPHNAILLFSQFSQCNICTLVLVSALTNIMPGTTSLFSGQFFFNSSYLSHPVS